jgi:hypothetical protein
VIWTGNRQFLGIAPFCHLVDLDAGGVVSIYSFPKDYRPPAKEEWSDRPATEMSAGPCWGVWLSGPPREPDPWPAPAASGAG